MLKKIKKRGFIAVLIFLGLFSAFSTLAISFTNDVKLDLTGLTSEVYINGDPTGSQCDPLTVSGANLTVSGIPSGNPFTLENVSDVVLLRLTPSGATGSFSLTSANVSGGYIIQWNTTSSILINYIVKVPLANTNYDVKVNSVSIAGSPFNSGASAQLSFGYTGAGTFTVSVVGGVVPPTLTTSAATSILTTSATLNGNITNTGGANALERGFDWGTSPGVYTGSGTTVGSYGTGAFTRGITGLTASTTYYFRSKARNSAGWAYGPELSFPTAAVAGDISTCQTLNTAGQTYRLINNITTSGNCFFIGANNITLDLNGYTITGDGATGSGVVRDAVVRSNITVKNGTIDRFENGVVFNGVQGGLIENITATNNADFGIYLSVSSANITVRNNNVSGNLNGIQIFGGANNNTIENNTATNNSIDGIHLEGAGAGNILSGNQSNFNGRGFWIFNSSGNTFTNNTANNNSPNSGFEFSSSSNNTVTGNTANNNAGAGFSFSSTSTFNSLTNNIANNNNYGIRISDAGSINNNISGGNFCRNNSADASCLASQASFSNNSCNSGTVCGGVCIACPVVPPTLTTSAATSILTTSATLNGNITNTGGANALERGFDWGTSPGVYTGSGTTVGSYGTGAFTRGITGLTASTTYYFRSKARNSAGWGYGPELSFTTTVDTTCKNHEIWGYAWSMNIGSISFSCKNCDSDNNGYIDAGACGGNNTTTSSKNYGVDIDELNSRLSGYAWSEHIGWISFNNTDLVGCPSGTCAANINMSTGALSGWARALAPVGRPLSETGGWDGWIKLSGSNYGVTLNSTPDPSEFQNWAWGGDPNNDNNEAVIGLISFNRANCDSDRNGFSDGIPAGCPIAGTAIPSYAVKTNLSINTTPTAAISCIPASCTIYETEILQLINNSTDLEGNITKSEWSTKLQAAPSYNVRQTCTTVPILCNLTFQIPMWGSVGNYTARLVVTDAGSLSNTATKNFSILRDASAGFMCSLNEFGPWEDCDSMTTAPLDGQIVWFFDDSSLTEYSQASQGASINSRTWQRIGDPIPFSVGNTQKTNIAASLPSMDIRLIVVDNAGRSASITHNIGATTLPLPTWNEVAPF